MYVRTLHILVIDSVSTARNSTLPHWGYICPLFLYVTFVQHFEKSAALRKERSVHVQLTLKALGGGPLALSLYIFCSHFLISIGVPICFVAFVQHVMTIITLKDTCNSALVHYDNYRYV